MMNLDEQQQDEYYAVPKAETFDSAAFREAPDVERIAAQLMTRHLSLRYLGQFSIAYLWKAKGGVRAGMATLGKCEKASPLVRFFGEHDLVIWLAADHCRELQLNHRQVEALVFHELCHPSLDAESGELKIVGHDFEGFTAELQQYGPWSAELQVAARAFLQLRLDLDGDGGERDEDGEERNAAG